MLPELLENLGELRELDSSLLFGLAGDNLSPSVCVTKV